MRILVEEHKYPLRLVKDDLWEGVSADPDETVTFKYVGYFYNSERKDCVLLLPRVLLEDVKTAGGKNEERVFVEHGDPADRTKVTFAGYTLEEIVDPDVKNDDGEYLLKPEHRKFIREFAVWIYRAIELYYRENQNDEKKRSAIYRRFVPLMGRGALKESHTLLDVILAMLDFQKEHGDFILTTFRNRHRGLNKVNWTRTVAKSSILWAGKTPVYIDPVNKRREIDFDDELFCIYHSILEYVGKQFGFKPLENPGFATMTDVQFRHFLSGAGRIRLRQIKGKYFSDLALRLWELCFAFFDHHHEIRIQANKQEFLLAKNFQIVFEAIIDELIGDKNIPAGLKEQEDGKRVDHMYRYRGLTVVDGECVGRDKGDIYYIGDSKYYKRRTPITNESVYKQFTYARNVIQWNLNLFLDQKDLNGNDLSADVKAMLNAGATAIESVERLRDDATEGYAITPNFFISARMDDDLDYNHDEITDAQKEKTDFFSRQFENRLFDRDTLLIAHYDVNFLFVVSRYARNNAVQKQEWREKVREIFRTRVRAMLQKHFTFYAMTPKGTVDAEAFFRENFKDVIGRIYSPYGKRGGFEFYSLALRQESEGDFEDENAAVLGLLRKGFKVEKCALGQKPEEVVSGEARVLTSPVASSRLTFHWLENYLDASIVFGFCKGDDHLKWMMNRVGDKASDMYNLRADRKRHGCVDVKNPKVQDARFLILYFENTESDNRYRVFRIRKGVNKAREWLLSTGYKKHSDPAKEAKAVKKYYCYYLEEEVSLGQLNVAQFLTADRLTKGAKYIEGEPIFVTGKDVLKWREDPPVQGT